MFYCIGTADFVPETAVAINIRLLNLSTIPQSAWLPEFSLNHSVSQAVLLPAAIALFQTAADSAGNTRFETHAVNISGKYSIIDLDLSKYDRIAARFQREAKDAVSFLKSGIDTRNPRFNQLIEQIPQSQHADRPASAR